MSARYRIELVAGTRPEAIKVAPLVRSLRDEWPHAVTPAVVATGQHPTMVVDGLRQLAVEADAQFALERANERIAGLAAPLTMLLDEHLAAVRPSAVVVQGDTTSALVAAQVAHWHGIPVVHLEAGLRTGDLGHPFPEEANRRGIAAVASLHLAPTPAAAENLLGEGIDPSTIVVTGNTVVDALCTVVGREHVWPHRAASRMPSGPVVVTIHRRESWGPALAGLCGAVRRLAEAHPHLELVWPVHPGSQVHGAVHAALAGVTNVDLTDPLPYADMMRLLSTARLVLTDSGGLQEEAAALGVPALVLRSCTERPEGVALGAAVLVGTDPDTVVAVAGHVLDDVRAWRAMASAGCPYGDGEAGPRAAQAIVDLVVPRGGLASAKPGSGRPDPLSEPSNLLADQAAAS